MTMNVQYDFTFTELAIKFYETGDCAYLQQIADSKAAELIFQHALHYSGGAAVSALELVTSLLTPADEHREKLPQIIKNVEFAKNNIVNTGAAEKIALEYLPKGFTFSSTMFFTVGYDIGVGYGNNCTLNLSHPLFAENMDAMVHYAAHELHHAGFLTLKGGDMLSLKITTRKEMTNIIEHLTHLEGMGTYACLDIIAPEQWEHINDYEKEYFEIYRHFKDNPNEILTGDDWHKLGILSSIKRLWYIVGAHIAQTIDRQLGREKLTSLINEPPENFFAAYMSI